MSDTNKRLVLVTGASRGIGLAVAQEFASNKGNTYQVIGTSTSEAGFAAFKDFSDYQVRLDLADPSSIDEAMKAIQTRFGALPDILVNNAGITADNLALRMKLEDWNKVINTNLTGTFYITQACVKSMLKNRWGRVISIGSVVGFMGNPGQANYCAAKAGLAGLTKSLAKELGSRNITVNLVAPGFIETDMTKSLAEPQQAKLMENIPLSRLGKPQDIAYTVAFLASDAASYITGETIHVNGGMYMN
ncbi:MAG: 3-oxoacyl-[acyl-carrier-protein] reductase [Gammaproteobacteria bacterium]